MNSFETTTLFENRFWLQILGDHSRFIFDALAPSEKDAIQHAAYFIGAFDQLLEKSRSQPNDAELIALNQQASGQAKNQRAFKLDLLKKSLIGQLKIGLPPTFINHMVNEIDEYITILNFLAAGQIPPPVNPLHYHLIWLRDAVGHAASLASDLDEVEQELIRQSQAYMALFNNLYSKAVEFSGYLRTCLNEFPALSRFNQDVEGDMLSFKELLIALRNLRMAKEVLGRFSPLVPDHMDREECYYLIKLAQVSTIKMPDCDPGRPRVE